MLVTMTGLVLMACEENVDSSTGIWHFGLGILLVILCSVHIIRKKITG